jgi:glycosyltransferase involved in cell wall biosynthesis
MEVAPSFKNKTANKLYKKEMIMKIVMSYLDPFDRPIEDKVVTGGIEMFSKLIYQNFNNVSVFQPKFEDDRKTVNENFVNFLRKEKPDLVITNHEQAMFSNRNVVEAGFPIFHVTHMNFCVRSYLDRLKIHNEYNHSIYCVSPTQQMIFNKMATRCGVNFGGYAGIIRPSFIEDLCTKFNDIEYDVTTIARLGSQKNPFLLKKLAEGTDLSTSIFTSKYEKDDERDGHADEKYINKVSKWFDSSVSFGLPNSEIKEQINKAKVFLSTWKKESFGITALEALSKGLPIILLKDTHGGHASTIIPADEKHMCLIDDNQISFVEAFEKLKGIDRKEIAEKTFEKHNKEKWIKDMTVEFEKTIFKYHKNRNTGLEAFINP